MKSKHITPSEIVSKIIEYLFEATAVFFILFFILEILKTGLITNYFNFNILLILLLVLGIMNVIFSIPEESEIDEAHQTRKQRRRYYFYAALGAILAFSFVSRITPATYQINQLIPWVSGLAFFILVITLSRSAHYK